ncbi:MAG: 6,7-dimethyl-8-ribityllumazine synthase [Spirochaetaceae bacterium]|nr:MAG: 6,7-dimethyl-8-ribityllumazine synthase [Spirochaetaceae bacterium]
MTTQEINGILDAKGLRIAIVVARFNSLIGEQLIIGAVDCLTRHGGDAGDITVMRVPGAFEIPFVAKKAAETGRYDAIVCLGAVIRGSTPHFDYVAAESAKGVAQASLSTGIPVINGIITTNDIEQALERAGTKAGNKGWDAAMAAIEMASITKQLST